MEKPIGYVFGILFLGWLGWIFMPSSAHERLDRACLPVSATGKVMVAVTDLTVPRITKEVAEWMDDFDYSCEYTLWRAIYGSDYAKAKQEMDEVQFNRALQVEEQRQTHEAVPEQPTKQQRATGHTIERTYR